MAQRGVGSIPATVRRQALLRYEELALPQPPPSRFWKHDYTNLTPSALAMTATTTDRTHEATPQRGVINTSFEHAREQHPLLFERAFGRAIGTLDDPFTALALAFQNGGRFIHVAPNTIVDHPIILGYELTRQCPYTLIFLEEGAQAVIVEELSRESADPHAIILGISEAVLESRARLTYACVQRRGEGDSIFMTRRAHCGSDAHVSWALAELGGILVRTRLRCTLSQPGASTEVTALFFNNGQQHVDLATDVDHIIGPTRSNTLVKSVATDHGQGRYLGNIVIRAGAHGAEAGLRDDALLLSKDAHIDSIPALEIASNDVKAYHGATVGSIDEEELFYVTSRGIARKQAERMIALGFFEPALDRFPGTALRESLRAALQAKLG